MMLSTSRSPEGHISRKNGPCSYSTIPGLGQPRPVGAAQSFVFLPFVNSHADGVFLTGCKVQDF